MFQVWTFLYSLEKSGAHCAWLERRSLIPIIHFLATLIFMEWEIPYLIFTKNLAIKIFSWITLVTYTSKKEHLISTISLRWIRIWYLWISSNFGQATFKEGALENSKIIYGLIHQKLWKPAKAFLKFHDSNWG